MAYLGRSNVSLKASLETSPFTSSFAQNICDIVGSMANDWPGWCLIEIWLFLYFYCGFNDRYSSTDFNLKYLMT